MPSSFYFAGSQTMFRRAYVILNDLRRYVIWFHSNSVTKSSILVGLLKYTLPFRKCKSDMYNDLDGHWIIPLDNDLQIFPGDILLYRWLKNVFFNQRLY